MGNRNDSNRAASFRVALSSNAPELLTQVALLHARNAPRARLRAQPLVAFVGMAAFVLIRAALIARAQSNRGAQMLLIGKLLQLRNRRPEAPRFRSGFPICRSRHHTNRDELLAHINASSSLDHCCNHRSLLSAVKSTICAYAKIFLLGPYAPLGDSHTPIQPVSFPSSHQYPSRPISSRPPNSLPFSSPGCTSSRS